MSFAHVPVAFPTRTVALLYIRFGQKRFSEADRSSPPECFRSNKELFQTLQEIFSIMCLAVPLVTGAARDGRETTTAVA